MSRISENIMLLGLIVKTKPFQYSDNMVTCSFEDYIEIEELELLKSNLEQELSNLSDSAKTDDNIRSFNDDIYFIDYIIQTLKSS